MQSSTSVSDVSDRVLEFLGCLHGSLCLLMTCLEINHIGRFVNFFFNIVQALPASLFFMVHNNISMAYCLKNLLCYSNNLWI